MFYNKNNFLVGKVASKDDTRPILNSIKFENEATVATDGYSLMICETPKDTFEADEMGSLPSVKDSNYNVCVPLNVADNISKSIPKNPVLPWASNSYFTDNSDNEVVEMISTDGVNTQKHTGRAVLGEYPKYAEVIPSGKPLASVSLNAKYLKRIVDTLCSMSLKDDKIIKINVFDSLMPITIQAVTKEEQNVQAVLMPVKTKGE